MAKFKHGVEGIPEADSTINIKESDVVGNKEDTAIQTVSDTASLIRYLKGLLTAFGNPTADTLTTISTKLGNLARSLTDILGTRWDTSGDLGSDIGRQLFVMDFWSTPQEEVQLTTVAGDKSLPSVIVADLPTGATITRAIAIFKFRMIENTNVAANKLSGAQEIQVNDSAATGWLDAINFVDDQYGIAASTREGGEALLGAIDVSARVDGNDTYSFQWDEAVADVGNLQFNDVQCGLKIWYSV